MNTKQLRFVGAVHNPEEAQVMVLGIPLERTVSFRGGPGQGPTAIRLASSSLETYSHLFRRDLADLAVADVGDVDCDTSLLQALDGAELVVRKVLAGGAKPVVLGGEHTVTLSGVRAAAHRGPVQLVAFDAHSDLRDEYRGERICHATVLRRCAEVVRSLHIVGARSLFGGELEEPFFTGPEELTHSLVPQIPLWISIDLDALDPSECPGVTNPEPGGLSYLEVVRILERLRGWPVVGVDVTELAPPFDPSGISSICAAKLVIEAICALL